ncbi:TRAP transporter large permease [Variovorax sp. J22G21]|uniref:TRAP transporter large permease n=1 Tax=Variovorax fucosicus TaxID=3053517 RepID=UPI0025788462|nr:MULTISPECIES: TRAP transporter large permease [unclassified Variovorax]MDM0040527.1 TRAP transporter large permease [Variovorax sp. J22R193]MDM0058645.1 TRAP transporter large permease [Variovorax sp. J22G47]MDM0061900.1 TRAP transporter large permease [Variovorax sp. J22G21]
MELTVLALTFTVLLVIGVPVAFSIGLASIATVFVADLPIAVVFQKMVGGMQIFSFLAIPFFVFAGELMLYGGIAQRIVRFANSLVGHVRGGLGMSNVIGCTLFGGVAGSPVADVSAMGSVMIPLMKKEGYDADYAVNVTTHAALVGALMPTSHNLIIFTLATTGIASVSVLSLILAGLIPALLLTVCNLAAAYYVAIKRGYPIRGAFPGWGEVLSAFIASLPGLMIVVIILVGILSGVFTATESAATAVLWALAVTVFVYRSLTWKDFLKACAKACKTTGVVLLLIGISSAFGYFMALYEVPQKTGDLMTSVSSTPWVIFLMINVLLFVLGTFLDMAATILICTPIFLPIAMQFGMSPVQFGIVMLINCALGLNTPPVGTTQFIGCAIGGVSVGQVMRSIWPFYGALLVCLMLVTYVPAFSMWLPDFVASAK